MTPSKSLSLPLLLALFFSLAWASGSAHADDDEDDLAKLSPAQRSHVQDLLNQSSAIQRKAEQDPTNRALKQAEKNRATGQPNAKVNIPGADQDTVDAYSISEDIKRYFNEKSGGDPNKLQELIQNAQKDPNAFADQLPGKSGKRLKKALDETH